MIKFTILISTSLILLASCQQEYSRLRPTPMIERDTEFKPREGFSFHTRPANYVEMVAGKGKGKGPKGKPANPPTDTTGGGGGDTTSNPPPPPPPIYGGPVILVDADGHYITRTSWNANGNIDCAPANMTPEEVKKVVDSMQHDYAQYGITVTADSTVYLATNPYKRTRVVITETWQWYGQAGGVAYIGSFAWGDDTPAFVFSSLLGYNTKYVFEAASHEAGHTIGLRHQSEYKLNADGSYYRDIYGSLVKESEYDSGTPELAPIMGVGYYAARSEFRTGYNSAGQLVNEPEYIRSVVTK